MDSDYQGMNWKDMRSCQQKGCVKLRLWRGGDDREWPWE